MLPSNGKLVVEKRNLHMEPDELFILSEHVRRKYEMKWFVMIVVQFGMGLRCSEMLAIHLADFSNHFWNLDYRQAKTNKMIYGEPVPEEVRGLIIAYIIANAHRMKDGFLFPRFSGNGPISTTTTGAMWSKWRTAIAKKHPKFGDKYPITISGKTHYRYRIATHSLRRLHRTILADKHPDRLFLLSKLCHYEKFEKFLGYVNDYKMMKERMNIIMPVINPVIHQMLKMPASQKRLTAYDDMTS